MPLCTTPLELRYTWLLAWTAENPFRVAVKDHIIFYIVLHCLTLATIMYVFPKWTPDLESLPLQNHFCFHPYTALLHPTSELILRDTFASCFRYSTRLLAWTPDNPLRNAANAGLIAVIFAKHQPKKYACWAESQARYMLGSGPHSFVVGYGNYPKQSLDKVR